MAILYQNIPRSESPKLNMKAAFTTILICFVHFILMGQTISNGKDLINEIPPENTSLAHQWWNLLYYDISIHQDHIGKFIEGSNEITFAALDPGQELQIDLHAPMKITAVVWDKKKLDFRRIDSFSYIVRFPSIIGKKQKHTIKVQFKGQPKESKNPPYDSGWIWSKDEKGRPWVSVACQGTGASIWLPCKEVLYDEPDNGVSFSITVSDSLTAIANGRLTKREVNKNKTTTYTWKVVNPINHYNIVPYIGRYETWHKDFNGVKGKLDCDYWVLDYNLSKGKKHFQQADTMLHAFEYWLGPYPFYEDGYKLIEAPHPGMEHQSAIAYGNGFQNGFQGKDFISGTKWSLKWDFMIVHESGHEWFGNSITCNNHGDTWIHEGFTKYLEVLYTSYVFGVEAGNDYAIGTWKRIKNDQPILGTGTSDKYYKGGAMLHMIRQITGDSLFRELLIGLNRKFYHKTADSGQIFGFFNSYTKRDFSKIFDQYLKTIQVPMLEYSFINETFLFRWNNCIQGFDMPVKITLDGKSYQFISPTTQWQELKKTGIDPAKFKVDRNFYVTQSKVN